MNRRNLLKLLGVGGVSASAAVFSAREKEPDAALSTGLMVVSLPVPQDGGLSAIRVSNAPNTEVAIRYAERRLESNLGGSWQLLRKLESSSGTGLYTFAKRG